MKRAALLTGLFLFLLPLAAHAEHILEWNFQGKTAQDLTEWSVSSLSNVSLTEAGLSISTSTQGNLTWAPKFSYGIDALVITYSAPAKVPLIFGWHLPGNPPTLFRQYDTRLPATVRPAEFSLPLGGIKTWNRSADRLAFVLPEGASLTLHSIRITSYNPVEKAIEAMKSFWTFDSVGGYSVNFLWGPHIVTSPSDRAVLFEHQPPLGFSGTFLFYWALALLGLYGLFTWWRSGWTKEHGRALLRSGLIAFLALWVVFDVRMGAEFLGIYAKDAKTYWNQPIESRTYRTLGHFTDFIAAVRGALEGEKKYVFLSAAPSPYRGLARYFTYPALPVTPESGSGALFWLVYNRPDVTYDPLTYRLTVDGQPISPPGGILQQYEPGTFIFQNVP